MDIVSGTLQQGSQIGKLVAAEFSTTIVFITVNIKNSEASGSWWKINKQSDSPKDEISWDVFKLWLNHGERPSEETYEYIIVPAILQLKIWNKRLPKIILKFCQIYLSCKP